MNIQQPDTSFYGDIGEPASQIADAGSIGNALKADRPISSMMEKNVLTVHAENTVAQVEEILSMNNFSSVPVVGSNGVVIGMISSKELINFHAEKKNGTAVRAWEICRITHFEVGPDASVMDVAKLMVDHRIQHIAVTENGNLYGLVSAIDFVEQVTIKDVL